jgi:DNA-binding transcriptional LysR family regulator
VGVSPGAHATAEPILDQLASAHPYLRLEVRQDATAPLLAELRSQRLDLVVGVSVLAGPMFRQQLLRLDEAVVVLHPSHALAGRGSVALEELGDETFVIAPEKLAPGYNQALVGFCAEAGFAPKTLVTPGLLAPPGVPPEQWVLVLTPGAAQAMQLGFEPTFLRLDPPRFFRIELIWRTDADARVIETFRSAASSVAQRMGWRRRIANE